MRESFYTLAEWRVRPGREDDFITAWKEMGVALARLPHPPADKGTLVRSLSEPTLFYSFGPWKRKEDIEAMRADPHAGDALKRLSELCAEASPGSYQVVAESQ